MFCGFFHLTPLSYQSPRQPSQAIDSLQEPGTGNEGEGEMIFDPL